MGKRFVSFGIGGSRWCLPAAEVVQIVRHENVHALPDSEPPVTGVVTLHGEIVPVVDLRERLAAGEPAADGTAEKKQRIVVVRFEGRPCGVLVDEVRELVDLEEDGDVEAAVPPLPPFAAGRAIRGDQSLLILDMGRAMGTRGGRAS